MFEIDMFKRCIKREIPWNSKYDSLAVYNSEVNRGIVHTSAYDAIMRNLQKLYNKEYLKKDK
jgi:hypothetical protein